MADGNTRDVQLGKVFGKHAGDKSKRHWRSDTNKHRAKPGETECLSDTTSKVEGRGPTLQGLYTGPFKLLLSCLAGLMYNTYTSSRAHTGNTYAIA